MQDMTKPSKRDLSKKDLGLFFTKKDLGTQKMFLNKTNKTPKGRVFDKAPKA